MAQTDWKTDVPLEERKRKLLAEGALFRIGIMQARGTVRANLTAESLAKGALSRIVGAVSSTFGAAFSGKRGGTLQSLSPLLIGGISLLSKRYLRKPLLYGTVISAGAAFAYYLTRREDRAQNAPEADDVDNNISTPDGE
ncbi:hypothetical protein [Herbaspirillum sp. RV1423]|uniref:hypothetical protein n=1 Tax=Herbaspirillum sp. RV1423 TaxID=1443993 RepID=UPI0004B1E24D|nr:hypothetical protein [Herbaspirillum sp. RV1423]